MRCVPRWGTAAILGALGAFAVQVGCSEEQILRAGLTIDLESGSLRPSDLGHGFAGGDVYDQNWHVDHLGQTDCAVCRFVLGEFDMTDRMELGCIIAALDKVICQPTDHVMVFGMDHDHRAMLSGCGEYIEHLAIVEFQ